MKIRYKYQPAPEDTTHYGVDFIGGVADVSDPELIAKFASHPHFEAEDFAERSAEPAPANKTVTGEGDLAGTGLCDALRNAATTPAEPAQDDRAALAAEYEEVFGKKPHHKMKAETIREALNNANDG